MKKWEEYIKYLMKKHKLFVCYNTVEIDYTVYNDYIKNKNNDNVIK